MEVVVVADFVMCWAANFVAMNREPGVLEVPIWVSFEIFLYPFYDPYWVIINTLHKYVSSQGKYVVTVFWEFFYTQGELSYCMGDFYPETSVFILFASLQFGSTILLD